MYVRKGKELGLIYIFASACSFSLSLPDDINLPKKRVEMTARSRTEEEEKDDKDEDRPPTGDCCCQTKRGGRMLLRKRDTPLAHQSASVGYSALLNTNKASACM